MFPVAAGETAALDTFVSYFEGQKLNKGTEVGMQLYHTHTCTLGTCDQYQLPLSHEQGHQWGGRSAVMRVGFACAGLIT